MSQIAAAVVTSDEKFRQQVGRLLRTGPVSIAVLEDKQVESRAAGVDLVVVDVRTAPCGGALLIEQLRARMPSASILAVAERIEMDPILQAMRAGANEFFAWNDEKLQSPGAMEEAFQAAVTRTTARRDTFKGRTRQPSTTLVFFGAKGGAGTTTMAVNCAVELGRLTNRTTAIVDLKASLGEVSLFLGIKSRFTVIDGIDNLHRLDRQFLGELVTKHKSGLDVLGGSHDVDRPGSQDGPRIEELLRVLANAYDFVVVDAGNVLNSCALAAFHAADQVFLVTTPDVPSTFNAQAIVERMRELGAGDERVRIILNRFGEQLMIGPRQIESALGHTICQTFPSDFRTVSAALNCGVPLTLTNHSKIAAQFDRFTRQIITSSGATKRAPEGKLRRFFATAW